MITHYLKVALRNLLKYKAHSFISAICLAIGITCFCLTNYFIDIVTAQTDLPDYERRVIEIIKNDLQSFLCRLVHIHSSHHDSTSGK